MKLVLSSSNKDKVKEIQSILGDDFQVILKSDIGLADFDVEENGKTLKENSFIKAMSLYKMIKTPTIADDTGLFVDALDGAPGVYSARFSGPDATYESNNEKLLRELDGIEDRSARFITDICLVISEDEVYHVEGALEGFIAEEKRGDKSNFGYNPLFIDKVSGKVLAEMDDDERLSINHRRKALENLKKLLGEIK